MYLVVLICIHMYTCVYNCIYIRRTLDMCGFYTHMYVAVYHIYIVLDMNLCIVNIYIYISYVLYVCIYIYIHHMYVSYIGIHMYHSYV